MQANINTIKMGNPEINFNKQLIKYVITKFRILLRITK
jgi:hypothetical protein